MRARRQRTKYRGVHLLEDGRYLLVTRYTDPRSGASKVVEQTVSAQSAPEAAMMRASARDELIAGLGRQRMRLSEYAHSWLARKRPELAPSTLDRYGRTLVAAMQGQVIACESEGADWLPFRALATTRSGRRKTVREVVWTRDCREQLRFAM